MTGRLGVFFLSCLLAFTAGHMFNYTVILYLQETVHSDLLAGIGFGLAFGSSLVFGWFAGVLCDRVPPHRIIHAAQALFLAGLGCIAWAHVHVNQEDRVAWVLAGALLGGMAWSFVGPARLTTLAQIVEPAQLRAATIIFNLQVLVGFGLAPFIIGVIRSQAGWGSVLAVAAGAFVAASVLILKVRTHTTFLPDAAGSVSSELFAGFRVVGADPLLRQLMFATVLAYAMTGPLQILLPKLAKDVLHLSEMQRGAYLGLLALSLIAGGVAALALRRHVRHGWVVFGGVMGGSVVFAALSQVTQAGVSATALAIVGIAGGMVVSLLVSDIQAQTPASVRGRVMGMYSITSQVVPAFSGVAAGVLVNAVGVVVAIVISGLTLAGIAALCASRMHTMRRLGAA